MLTLVHENPIQVRGGELLVDRKFHDGMQRFSRSIAAPLCAINPQSDAMPQTMDVIAIPLEDLAYRVLPVRQEKGRIAAADEAMVREQLANSTLVYGTGMGCGALARSMGKPYVALLEYDLGTRLSILKGQRQEAGSARTLYRMLWCLKDYAADVSLARGAHSVHCNGYPIYEALSSWVQRRLLYLDSRMARADVIGADDLSARLAGRSGRPLQLIYSGRYDAMKGALDAVSVAVECLRRGLDIEMRCFGQGSQLEEMKRLAATAVKPERISINGPVPFPELLRQARTCDVFVCCHVQADPSCTYLESMGCGLPIVGYANRMHRSMQMEAKAGFHSPVGDVAAVAEHVGRYVDDVALLAEHSRNARAFAIEHCYEKEFELRTSAINAALEDAGANLPSLVVRPAAE